MPNKIQLGEYSKSSGTDGIPRNSDGDPNLLNANRNDNGQWLNTAYDRPDNEWNRDNGFAFVVSQLSSFLSLSFVGRVFLYKASVPASQVSADFVQFL